MSEMTDNEEPRRPHHPRRNPPNRPPPGVQKAMNIFGVPDLREKLNKKHQEQGSGSGDGSGEQKVNLPPPDPSYNYLKDPTRDQPGPKPSSPKRGAVRKPLGRSRPRNQSSEQTDNREQETEEGPERDVPETADNQEQEKGKRSGRGFRGHFPRRGRGGRFKEKTDDKIENPINIKIELSTEDGKRSCTLDETTKIADIKHVPDQVPPHSSRPGARRGNFRGRGRGRGHFRGRGGRDNRENYHENPDSNAQDNSHQDISKESPDDWQQDAEQTAEKTGGEGEDAEETTDNKKPDDEAETTETVQAAEQENANGGEPFDAALVETITITSSKYQDGEVKRTVEVNEAAEAVAPDVCEKN